METSFVIAVALGVAVVVVILALTGVIVYLRWRISDSNAHLKAFIDENIDMRDKLNQYELGIGARNSNKSKPAMKKSLRKDQREQQLDEDELGYVAAAGVRPADKTKTENEII
jgi:ABC-type lipoprotein release transport system permease subunit